MAIRPKSKDPIVGTQDPSESIFVIPQVNSVSPIEIVGFSSFLRTKATAYEVLLFEMNEPVGTNNRPQQCNLGKNSEYPDASSARRGVGHSNR